MDIYNFMF